MTGNDCPVLQAIQGDITKEAVDAIVNAANTGLAGGGGVDGAIHRAAGAAKLQAACRPIAPCPVGEARVTPAFALPAKWIIHTVGPIWRGGNDGEARLLANCYRNSVDAAREVGASSIAFPAISTGVYGYPKDDAARIAVEALSEVGGQLEIRLIAFDTATLDLYRELLL